MYKFILISLISLKIFALDVAFKEQKFFVQTKPNFDPLGDADKDKYKFSVCTNDLKTCLEINSCEVSQKDFNNTLKDFEIEDESLKDEFNNLLLSSGFSSYKPKKFIMTLEKILAKVTEKNAKCKTISSQVKSCEGFNGKLKKFGLKE